MTTPKTQDILNFAAGWRKDRAITPETDNLKVGDVLLKTWADGKRALVRVVDTNEGGGGFQFTYLKADGKTKFNQKVHTADLFNTFKTYARARRSHSAPVAKAAPSKVLKAAALAHSFKAPAKKTSKAKESYSGYNW